VDEKLTASGDLCGITIGEACRFGLELLGAAEEAQGIRGKKRSKEKI